MKLINLFFSVLLSTVLMMSVTAAGENTNLRAGRELKCKASYCNGCKDSGTCGPCCNRLLLELEEEAEAAAGRELGRKCKPSYCRGCKDSGTCGPCCNRLLIELGEEEVEALAAIEGSEK